MESLKSEIRQLIHELSDRFDHLPEGTVHPLDADLLLSLLRQLYVKTEAMRMVAPTDEETVTNIEEITRPVSLDPEPIQTHVAEFPVTSPPVIPFEEKPEQAPVHPEFIPAEHSSGEKNVSHESPHLIVSEFNSESEFVRDPGPEVNKPVSVPVDLFGAPTIADKLKSDTPSLNDRITSGRSDLSLADRMQLKPISDLKSAIGLNDKFQFINELFEGSSDRYTEAVNLLNSCIGIQEAEMLLADLKSRYSWNDQNQVWKKLREFIVRRYM
jgi:hypothetical protein